MHRDGLVVVIDDDPAIRRSLESLFQAVRLPYVSYGSVEEFEAEYTQDFAGCVVLDIRLPGKSGVVLHEELVDRGSALSVVVVSGHGDVPMAVHAMKRGATDFLEKPYRPQELLDRINQGLENSRGRQEAKRQRKSAATRWASLTARESEVVELAITGMRNREIANRMGVTSQAIDARRARAMQKLEVTNIPELVAFFRRLPPRDQG